VSTIRLLSPQYRAAREKRRDAIGFFRRQEQSPDMPHGARNVAGVIARALELIYRHSALTGGEKEWMFRRIIQNASKYGAAARV